jgi:hypothetical protein
MGTALMSDEMQRPRRAALTSASALFRSETNDAGCTRPCGGKRKVASRRKQVPIVERERV